MRVYWPDEGDFFHGEVAGYEPRSGLHTIFYEDGDVEEVRLASERFEWIATPRPGAGGAPPGGAQEPEGNGRRLVRKVAGEWPQAGDLLWGRVKVRAAQLIAQAVSATHALRCCRPPLCLQSVTPLAGARVVARNVCGD